MRVILLLSLLSLTLQCTAPCGHGTQTEGIDTPQDNRDARLALTRRPELKDAAAALTKLFQTHQLQLDPAAANRIFGPVLAKEPADRVLPLFIPPIATRGGFVPIDQDSKPNYHIDYHPIGDLGYAQFFYNYDGRSVGAVLFYLRADKDFVPLKSTDDFAKRLAWETPRFALLRQWLEGHVPTVPPR
jgi:hypothetical protein